MLGRVRLEEIAELAYNVCKRYAAQMKGYGGFEEEMARAEKNRN